MPHDASDFETEFEQALAAYADPGDAGYPQTLATRVTAAIDARRRKRRWWFGVSVTAPVLGCVLVMVFLWLRQPDSQHRTVAIAPASTPSTAPVVTAIPKAAGADRPHLETARRQVVHSAPRPLPKLDQFPAPTALTEQEQILVQFVTHAPADTQQLVAKTQKEPAEPLHIAALVIPKLDSNTQPK